MATLHVPYIADEISNGRFQDFSSILIYLLSQKGMEGIP